MEPSTGTLSREMNMYGFRLILANIASDSTIDRPVSRSFAVEGCSDSAARSRFPCSRFDAGPLGAFGVFAGMGFASSRAPGGGGGGGGTGVEEAADSAAIGAV